MASKRFAGRLCIYCGNLESTSTGDHVLARSFVAEKFRKNLPKVPCCISCNSTKAELEHYLATVLPFGNRQENALELLLLAEPKLRKNTKLARLLAAASTQTFDPYDQGNQVTKAFPFDSQKLLNWAHFLTLGLLHVKLNLIPTKSFPSFQFFPTYRGDLLLRSSLLCQLNGHKFVGELASGAVKFKSNTSYQAPLVSVWRFEIFEGLTLTDDDREFANSLWVFLASERQIEQFRKLS